MTAPEALLLVVAALLGSAAQSATGFGVALPVAPAALAVLAPVDAVLATTLTGLAHNLLFLGSGRRGLAVRTHDVLRVLLAAAPGLALGTALVTRVAKPPIQLAVGVAILMAVGAGRRAPGRAGGLARPGAWLPVGLAAGVLGTTVGISGPPLVVWLRARQIPLAELRDTLALIFLALNLVASAALLAGGGHVPGAALAALAGGLGVGHLLGVAAARRLRARTLDRAILALLALAGGASLVAGAAALA